MLKIGHRGAAGHEIENTPKSFQKAIDLNVDIIELDVHRCATGELVVFHDRKIERLTKEAGRIRKMTLWEIKKLRTIDGQNILTLTEALDFINGRCVVNIEMKSRGLAKELAETVQNYIKNKKWQIDQFIISSFFHKELSRIKEINRNFKIGLLYYRHFISIPKKAKKMEAYSVHLNKRYLQKEVIEILREQGIKIFIWTINHPHEIKQAKDLKVDGVISDFPDLI